MGEAGTSPRAGSLRFAFLMVATLFFIWGFCHAMLDVLNKHFQDILHVSKAQSGLIQSAVFGAYFLMALPSALLIRRIGYRGGILVGLALLAIGAFLFIPAGLVFRTFGAFLGALFVLSSGLACIETAANPYVTVLGPKEGAAGRLSTAQAFNSLAYILAPMVGGAVVLGGRPSGDGADFHSLITPYVALGCVVLLVLAVFSRVTLPEVVEKSEGDPAERSVSLLRQPHFVWGVATQFLYVAAQVGVNAFALNFILENAFTQGQGALPGPAPLFGWMTDITGAARPESAAAYVISIAMVLYALGRFSGGWLSRFLAPERLLALFGLCNVLVMLLVVADIPRVSWMILPLSWLFMSIMFPFIFALSLQNLGARTKLASSFLIMAIVGGAVSPPLMGWIADVRGEMAICFLLPLVGFAATALYGLFYQRLDRLSREEGPA